MWETFWKLYPKKVAKKDAFKAWNKLTPEQQELAMQALPNHARRWEDPQYIPHAATWLNGWRFEDELPPIVQVDQRTGLKLVNVSKPILPVEEQIPSLKVPAAPKPEGLGALKNLVKQREHY